MKTLKERDNLDLLELTLQLHARVTCNVMSTLEQNQAYMEARAELEARLTVQVLLVNEGHICKVDESCGQALHHEIEMQLSDSSIQVQLYGNDGNDNQEKIEGDKAKEILKGWIFDWMEEYRQQPSGDDKFAFAVWLTGHDEATIKQMYDDFCNSGKDAFKPLTQMPQYNHLKTSADTEIQPGRTDADWQELLTLRSENMTLKEMVAKHGGVDLKKELVKFIRWYHKRALIEHINTDEYLIDRYLKLQTP